MADYIEKITSLTKQLYPTGRAFKMPKAGWLESLHNGLRISENKAMMDAMAILNSILPDNDNFTEADATDWERRLGLINSTGNPLADRKLAIRRKIQHPGDIKARQHYLYVQGQLQAAGFDVYVHENRFDDGFGGLITKTPGELAGYAGVDEFQYNDHQYGDAQYGGSWGDKVVNSINRIEDVTFGVGNNLRSTFFIGGINPGDYATVPANQERQFRQLILKLKPVQTVAYLFIVYV